MVPGPHGPRKSVSRREALQAREREHPLHRHPLLARRRPRQRSLECPHQALPRLHLRVRRVGGRLGFEGEIVRRFQDEPDIGFRTVPCGRIQRPAPDRPGTTCRVAWSAARPASPGHVPPAGSLHPVPGNPSIAPTRRSPVPGSPDISARAPTPIASNPDIAGIWRRAVILDTRRRRGGGDPSATVIGARRRDDAAAGSKRQSENHRQSAQAGRNSGHGTSPRFAARPAGRLYVMNAAYPPRCTANPDL